MDQQKIGRFIAQERKSLGLTQRQLADALDISDKTVSKWECGNGLPDVSLMGPLCQILHITVNDLLSGERVSPPDYQQKAEENLIHLVQENRESRQRMVLTVLCCGITAIAVGALVALAACLDLSTPARIGLVLLTLAVAAAGIGTAAVLDAGAGQYECPHCHARFVPTLGAYVRGVHTFTRRALTCPVCGKRGMCRRHITRSI